MFGGCPAFACAFVAGLLHLHLGDSHVHHLHDDTAAFACGALLGLSTFSAGPSAAGTVDIPVDVEGLGYAVIELLQRHIELQLVRGTLSPVVLFATPCKYQHSKLSLNDQQSQLTFRTARQRLHPVCCRYLAWSRQRAPHTLD